MQREPEAKLQSYHYIRYMRDGSVQEITAVVRSRAGKKKEKKKRGVDASEPTV
jgi:hypothetical protein